VIRAAWLVVGSLVIALMVQLTVLNGMRLPGGGVPDLVLVLVAALAMAEGPVLGTVTGFAAGLSLDLAPPGSAAIGQYALVFCLAGWAAGRLSPVATQSARQSAGLLATALLALVVAAAEVLSAAVSLLVAPAAVTLSQIRVVLPSTIAYDLVLCPFVLALVMLAGTLVADRSAGAKKFHGLATLSGHSAGPGTLAGTARSRRASMRAARQLEVRLGRSAATGTGGWLSTSRPGQQRGRTAGQHTARLRPGSGVPGSASGLVRHRTTPPAAVHLRLASGRRGDGVIGSALAAGAGLSRGQPARHPGLLAGSGRQFRPRMGEPGGSASGSAGLAASGPRHRQPTIRFTGHRGDGSFGQTLSHAPTRPGPSSRRRPSPIRFTGHRGDGSFGQTLSHAPTRPGPASGRRPAAIRFGQRGRAPSTAWLRTGADRSGAIIAGTGAVPSLRFASRPAAVSRRSAAVPRFRRRPALLRPARMSSGVVPGGALTDSTIRASRHRRPAPRRLRLSGGATGMLGGTGRGPGLRRPPSRTGKQPRFSYGKRSPLSVLAGHQFGRRLGGRWLARWRVGSRSGVWLLGRRPGGASR
jgi:rod shape-determining protein MreD